MPENKPSKPNVQIVDGIYQPIGQFKPGDKYQMGIFAEVIKVEPNTSGSTVTAGTEKLTVCATNYLCKACIPSGRAQEVGCHKATNE